MKKDYSFAEAIEEAMPRLQAAFTHMADQMQACFAGLADWWDDKREVYLEHYDELSVRERTIVDALEVIWHAQKDARP